MNNQYDQVIINRKKRKKRHASHSGAWKVAFADFTLAMMAFFMVLWIMQVADQKERTMIVQYLKGELYSSNPINPFDLSHSSSLIDFEGNLVLETSIVPSASQGGNQTKNTAPLSAGDNSMKNGAHKAIIPGEYQTQSQLMVLAKEIEQQVNSAGMAKNVHIQVVPQGIRILVHDNVNQFMFTRGSAEIQYFFEDLLLELGQLLGQISNGISISGHTDVLPFVGEDYTNWELSSQRALIARRILQAGGMTHQQIVQVTGMADQSLYIKDDPSAAANRRIELLVLTKEAEENLRMMTGLESRHAQGNSNISSHVDKAIEAAEQNQPRLRYPIND